MTESRVFIPLTLLGTLLALAVSVASATGANALPADSAGKGVNVMTLHIQRMMTLETALHKAVNERDTARLDKLLSPLFEIRRDSSVIIERDAWLREGIKSDGELHGLAAYEVGNSIIANFTLVATGQPNRFVVDVWTHEQDEWRLRVRFETAQARGQSKTPKQSMPNNR